MNNTKKQIFAFLLSGFLFIGCLSVDIPPAVSNQDTEEYIPPIDLSAAEAAPRALIPFPRKVVWGEGEWPIDRCRMIKKIETLAFSHSPEAYFLKIENGTIEIKANDKQGLRYAEFTLKQLSENGSKPVPACTIEDFPAFQVRGFHHDTGRNFQSISYLKEQISRLATYKLNTFHWHITDNPGWRLECKKYPILNDPATMYRSNNFYTYDEIRDMILFCRNLGIRVIIELDMPGHSKFFPKAFGFSMGSEKGTAICLDLIQEFCDEIPIDMAPVIHVGADEVRAPVIKEFMPLIESKLKENGRTGMVWNPGIKASKETIEQTWFENAKQPGYRNIDSSGLYTNTLDYFNAIQSVYFKQPCEVPEGSELDMGAIICNWNDVAVSDEKEVLLNNPVYSAGITAAEIFWNGNPTGSQRYRQILPPEGTDAFRAFSEFENRLLAHKKIYFGDVGSEFIYEKQSDRIWQLTGPSGETVEGRGISLLLDSYFPNAKKRQSAICRTEIISDTDKTVLLYAGFDVPLRAHRFYGGIPPKGKWDRYGSTITLNGVPIPPPEWKNPGAFRHDIIQTWDHPVQEVPWTSEELYWRRDPVRVQLKKGVNVIEIKAVKNSPKQVWMTALWTKEIENR